MTTLEYWLGMAFWAALMLIIHGGSNKPSKKYGSLLSTATVKKPVDYPSRKSKV